jgi:hypothetical protein
MNKAASVIHAVSLFEGATYSFFLLRVIQYKKSIEVYVVLVAKAIQSVFSGKVG